MCMITRHSKPYKSDRDITVFKALISDGGGGYVTPFTESEAILGGTLEAEGDEFMINGKNGTRAIGRGWIHCVLSNAFRFDGGNGIVLVKATIPAGTEFYVSKDLDEICAKRVVLGDTVFSGGTPVAVSGMEMRKILRPVVDSIRRGEAVIGWEAYCREVLDGMVC